MATLQPLLFSPQPDFNVDRHRALHNNAVYYTDGAGVAGAGVFDPARIGPSPTGAYGNTYASIDHIGRSYTAPGNYVILADTTNTFVNAPSAGSVFIRLNNADRGEFSNTLIRFRGTAAAETMVIDTNTCRSNFGFTMPQLQNFYFRGFGDTNHRIVVPSVAPQFATNFNVDGPCVVGFNNWILATGTNSHWQLAVGANYIQVFGGLGVSNGTNNDVNIDPESITTCSTGSGMSMRQRTRASNDGFARQVIYANNDQMVFYAQNQGDMVNFAAGSNVHIPMDLPNLGAQTPVVFTNGGGSRQLGVNTSSGRHKQNVRTLKETPELDSGPHNPVFKLRPVRFTWKQREHLGGPGVVDAKTLNDLHPNGIAGLIAEEVREIAPDAALVIPAKPEWHHNPEVDPEPEKDYNGESIIYRPAIPETIQSVDNDRLIAYLIDAVQYLKEELEKVKKNGK